MAGALPILFFGIVLVADTVYISCSTTTSSSLKLQGYQPIAHSEFHQSIYCMHNSASMA
jgi:hypothetical protein